MQWVSNVRPSVRPQKLCSISTKFGSLCRQRSISDADGMQGQGQGHEPLKVGFLNYGTILKACRGRIFYFCPTFCVT